MKREKAWPPPPQKATQRRSGTPRIIEIRIPGSMADESWTATSVGMMVDLSLADMGRVFTISPTPKLAVSDGVINSVRYDPERCEYVYNISLTETGVETLRDLGENTKNFENTSIKDLTGTAKIGGVTVDIKANSKMMEKAIAKATKQIQKSMERNLIQNANDSFDRFAGGIAITTGKVKKLNEVVDTTHMGMKKRTNSTGPEAVQPKVSVPSTIKVGTTSLRKDEWRELDELVVDALAEVVAEPLPAPAKPTPPPNRVFGGGGYREWEEKPKSSKPTRRERRKTAKRVKQFKREMEREAKERRTTPAPSRSLKGRYPHPKAACSTGRRDDITATHKKTYPTKPNAVAANLGAGRRFIKRASVFAVSSVGSGAVGYGVHRLLAHFGWWM